MSVPPVNLVLDGEWFDEAPVEPGYYWFFGDPWMGEMGGHYRGSVHPEYKLSLVSVFNVSNGLAAISDGHFFQLKRWDGKGKGWLGRWGRAVLPDVSGFAPDFLLDEFRAVCPFSD